MDERTEKTIPIVDLRILGLEDGSDPAPDALLSVGRQLTDAFADIGFVYVTNHGVPDELITRTFKSTGDFFELPLAQKEEVSVEKGHGYIAVDREKLSGDGAMHELRESFDVLYNSDRYPDARVPEFRSAVRQLIETFNRLAVKMLRALQLGLDVQDNVLVKSHSGMMDYNANYTIMRVLYYPPVPAQLPPGAVRCGEHSDYGTITILLQDHLGGLEVKTRKGVWEPAPPIEGALLINVGDLLQQWTSDRLIATKHRVIIPPSEHLQKLPRRSIAYFIDPDHDCVVEPLDGKKKYPPVKAKDYLDQRFAATYQY